MATKEPVNTTTWPYYPVIGNLNTSYNADNRPILFTRTEEDGTETQIACTYDHLGRRATKKVTVDGSITLHQRYLYREFALAARVAGHLGSQASIPEEIVTVPGAFILGVALS